MGKPSIDGPFSMAMLNNHRVTIIINHIRDNSSHWLIFFRGVCHTCPRFHIERQSPTWPNVTQCVAAIEITMVLAEKWCLQNMELPGTTRNYHKKLDYLRVCSPKIKGSPKHMIYWYVPQPFEISVGHWPFCGGRALSSSALRRYIIFQLLWTRPFLVAIRCAIPAMMG